MSGMNTAALCGLATATPKHELSQSDATLLADNMFSRDFSEFHRLKPVFENAGIEKRRTAMPTEWYIEPRDWHERTQAFLDVATDLFCKAAERAMDDAGITASDVDVVVGVTSSGIATPTLDARAADILGFRPDVLRLPLFGLGCAGGVSGLSLAARLAIAQPGINVLVVVVELCSLSFRMDKFTKSNVVATALFGDGAAGAVLSVGDDDDCRVSIDGGCEHKWPDTLGIMGWNIDSIGFEVVFDRDIPPFARRHLKPVVDEFVTRLGLQDEPLARLSFHPGGTKVLQALENAFELQTGTLDIEREVLRDYGNMSAPTALFVLDRVLNANTPGVSLLSALGPGFTAASVPVRVLQ